MPLFSLEVTTLMTIPIQKGLQYQACAKLPVDQLRIIEVLASGVRFLQIHKHNHSMLESDRSSRDLLGRSLILTKGIASQILEPSKQPWTCWMSTRILRPPMLKKTN